MKNIGIWLDKKKALLVTIENNTEHFETLPSELEFFNPKGGSGTKYKGGPQDVVQDSKYLEREKHQLKVYFNNLADAIGDANTIALFGPADTNEKFRKTLLKDHKTLATRLRTIVKTDSMTDNQVKALVRDYFRNKG